MLPAPRIVHPRDNARLKPTITTTTIQENLFEWHFTLRGPPGTDFAGGVYHGRILLPSEYPFKPPNIMLLTVRRDDAARGGERVRCSVCCA